MLKTWKTRALATAGAVALLAPFTFTGGAMAAGTAVLTSVQPPNGPAGAATVAVTGTGCGTPTTSTDTNTVAIIVTGPGLPSGTGTTGVGMITGPVSGDFTGSVSIPATAVAGDVFTIIARCTGSVSGAGPNSAPLTYTVLGTGGLVGGVVSGTGSVITGTSGATTTPVTPIPTTTGVATPIPQTPTFTG